MMEVDPRELAVGYAYPKGKGVTIVVGVLRDGKREVWRCSQLPGHRAHLIPTLATQCAGAELERRRQGAKEVLWLAHCEPCQAFWDLGLVAGVPVHGHEPGDSAYDLLRGICPVCTVPFDRVRVAILERQEAKVR
jgi:hypothetical protein